MKCSNNKILETNNSPLFSKSDRTSNPAWRLTTTELGATSHGIIRQVEKCGLFRGFVYVLYTSFFIVYLSRYKIPEIYYVFKILFANVNVHIFITSKFFTQNSKKPLSTFFIKKHYILLAHQRACLRADHTHAHADASDKSEMRARFITLKERRTQVANVCTITVQDN